MTFCKFLSNGMYYGHRAKGFPVGDIVSPCCLFSKTYKIDPHKEFAPQLVELRDQWQSEDLTETCKICIDAEANGAPSYRTYADDNLDGTCDNVEYISIAADKQCNLACTMCDSKFSSKWHIENKKAGVPEVDGILKMHKDDKAGIIADRLVASLATICLDDVKSVKFFGGEPLMSNAHTKVLDLIDNPSQVRLHYTSNFTIMPKPAVFKRWEEFNLVKWVASIDDVGDRFELLRWPAKWQKLQKFVESARNKSSGNVMFGIETTLTPLSVFYYAELEGWLQENISTNNSGDNSNITLHAANGMLDLSKTPPLLRDLVRDHYGNDHPITKILADKPYVDDGGAMIRYLDRLDSDRNTDWRTAFKEVAGFFE